MVDALAYSHDFVNNEHLWLQLEPLAKTLMNLG